MIIKADVRKKYPRLTSFIDNDVSNIKFTKPKVWKAFLKYSELTEAEAIDALMTCSNPIVDVDVMPNANGEFRGSTDPNIVFLAKAICERFEKDYKKAEAKLLIESTLLHEMVHWGDWKDGKDQPGEEGKEFEKAAYGKDINRYW